jgi:hypothetical protein
LRLKNVESRGIESSSDGFTLCDGDYQVTVNVATQINGSSCGNLVQKLTVGGRSQEYKFDDVKRSSITPLNFSHVFKVHGCKEYKISYDDNLKHDCLSYKYSGSLTILQLCRGGDDRAGKK